MIFVASCAATSEAVSSATSSAEPAHSENVVALVTVDIATDEILSKYDSFYEFNEFEDAGNQKIIFMANTAIRNFRFIEIGHSDVDTNIVFFENTVLHSLDELSAEKPFVVTWMEQGLLPHRGIAFEDENNAARYFYISMSGEDGSLLLTEFQ